MAKSSENKNKTINDLVRKIKRLEKEIKTSKDTKHIERAELSIEKMIEELANKYDYEYERKVEEPSSEEKQDQQENAKEEGEDMPKTDTEKRIDEFEKKKTEANKKLEDLIAKGYKDDSNEINGAKKAITAWNDRLIGAKNAQLFEQISELKKDKKATKDQNKKTEIQSQINKLQAQIEKNKEGYSQEWKDKKKAKSNQNEENGKKEEKPTSKSNSQDSKNKSQQKPQDKTKAQKTSTSNKQQLESEIQQLEIEIQELYFAGEIDGSPKMQEAQEKLIELRKEYGKTVEDQKRREEEKRKREEEKGREKEKKKKAQPELTPEQKRKNELEKNIMELETEKQNLYFDAKTDASPEIQEVEEKLSELRKEYGEVLEEIKQAAEREKWQRKFTPQQLSKIRNDLEKESMELEAKRQKLYGEGKTDNSPEIKEIDERVKKLNEEYSKLPKETGPKLTPEQQKIQNEINQIEEDIQMGMMEGRYTNDSPEVKEMKKRQDELRNQMNKAERTKSEPKADPSPTPEPKPQPNSQPNPNPEPNPEQNLGTETEPPLPQIRKTHRVGLMTRAGNWFANLKDKIVGFLKKRWAAVKQLWGKLKDYMKLNEEEIDDFSEEVEQQQMQESIEASSRLANEPVSIDLEEDEERDLQGAIRDIHNLNQNKMEIPDFLKKGSINVQDEENLMDDEYIDDEEYTDSEEKSLSKREQRAQEKRSRKEAREFAREARRKALSGNPVKSYGGLEFEDFLSRKNIERFENGELSKGQVVKLTAKTGEIVYLNGDDGSLKLAPENSNPWAVRPEDMGRDVPETRTAEKQDEEKVK